MIIKKNKKGFTLLETILVLGIAGVAATLALQEQARNLQTRIADISGAQIAEIGKATNAYMTAYYNDWPSDGSNANDLGSSDDGGPRNCNSSDICTISISTLVNNGFLNSWNPNLRNPFRSPYEIVIKKSTVGATGMPILNALIVTEDPYIPKAGGEVSFDLLGRAIQTAGAQAGFSRNIGSCSDTSICGYGGSFTVDSSEYSNVVTQEGQLGFYTGVTAQSISGGGVNDDYLRRDGTLPMYGNLDMGEGDIYNVRRIQGSETTDALADPNNTEVNPVSSMRIGNIRVSDNPAELPAVNAAPEFSTAANVPSIFEGDVLIDHNGSNGSTLDANDFVAVFRRNPTGTEKEFEIGGTTQTRFNNRGNESVEILGGLNLNGSNARIYNGSDGANPSYYTSNNSYFQNFHGETPVRITDSLSVSGIISNIDGAGGRAGVNIMDDNYIDLTVDSSAGLDSPRNMGNDDPQGWVTIGKNHTMGGYNSNDQTGLAIRRGPLYVDGNGACDYRGGIGCNGEYPAAGIVSANDFYMRDVSNTQKLSDLLPTLVLKNIQSTSGAYYTYINKPYCGDGTPRAYTNLWLNPGTYGGASEIIGENSYQWTVRNQRYGGGTGNPYSNVFIYCDYR